MEGTAIFIVVLLIISAVVIGAGLFLSTVTMLNGQDPPVFLPVASDVWTTEHRCVDCDRIITEDERFYSGGRCPHCGFKHSSACTIVQTTERGTRINPKIGEREYR